MIYLYPRVEGAQVRRRLEGASKASGSPICPYGHMDMWLLRNPDRGPGLNDVIFFGDLEGNLYRVSPATVDPGPTTVANPANPKGAAILAPGRHIGLWRLGLHRGRPGLVQSAICTVIRYTGGGSEYDLHGPTDTGWFGINFHSMGTADWSAGCCGPQSQEDVDFVRYVLYMDYDSATCSPILLDASAWNLNDLLLME